MDLGPHAFFIIVSYAAMSLILAALCVWLWLDGRRYQKALKAFEQRGGHRRRSQS